MDISGLQHHPAHLHRVRRRPAVLGGLDEFRQHLGGALTVPLVRRIGDSFEVHAIDERLVVESIEAMQGLAGAGVVANAAPVRLGA